MGVTSADRNPSADFSIEPGDLRVEASRMFASRDTPPGSILCLLGEVDLSEIVRVRTMAWSRRKVSYAAFVVKATALALRDVPEANRRVVPSSYWRLGRSQVQTFKKRDIAVAVDREGPDGSWSVLTEVLRSADENSLDQITSAIQVLGKSDLELNTDYRETRTVASRFPSWVARRISQRRLTSPQLWIERQGGAVLVTPAIKEGVDAVVGQWSHPIAVSFGLIKPRAVVVDDAVVARSTLVLSVSFDRRLLAVERAAKFFKRIVTILEHPTRELDDFRVAAGPFHDPVKVDGHSNPVAIQPPTTTKHVSPAPSSILDAPPTRIDFPTIESERFNELERLPSVPDTREDLPAIDDSNGLDPR